MLRLNQAFCPATVRSKLDATRNFVALTPLQLHAVQSSNLLLVAFRSANCHDQMSDLRGPSMRKQIMHFCLDDS